MWRLLRTGLLSASSPLHSRSDTLTFPPAHLPEQLHPNGWPETRNKSQSRFWSHYEPEPVSGPESGLESGPWRTDPTEEPTEEPGRGDQVLQQCVSRDQGGLSYYSSGLLQDLVSLSRPELLAGGDLSGSDAMFTEVLDMKAESESPEPEPVLLR